MSTLKRALAVLDLFTPETPVLSADDITARLGYSAPTSYRYIRDLAELGYLMRMTGGSYKLGPRIIELDHVIIDADPVLNAARPIMRKMVEQLGSDVLLSAVHGLRILNIHHEQGPDNLVIKYSRGRRHPLFHGATARVTIAHMNARDRRRLFDLHEEEIVQSGLGATFKAFSERLDEIKARGCYVNIGEMSKERASFAVPVFQEGRRIFGALTATFLAARMATISQEKTLELLMAASRRIALDAELVQRGVDQQGSDTVA